MATERLVLNIWSLPNWVKFRHPDISCLTMALIAPLNLEPYPIWSFSIFWYVNQVPRSIFFIHSFKGAISTAVEEKVENCRRRSLVGLELAEIYWNILEAASLSLLFLQLSNLLQPPPRNACCAVLTNETTMDSRWICFKNRRLTGRMLIPRGKV